MRFTVAYLLVVSAICSLTARSDSPIGSDCVIDSDCASSSCFYGEQLPGTPGTCHCNTVSNAGCASMETCFDDPWIADDPPVCVNLDALLPIHAACTDYVQCATYNCFQGRCACNPRISLGCEPDSLLDGILAALVSFFALVMEWVNSFWSS